MSLDRVVEEIIQAAMARGEFDNLPGQGKPLNLEAYFALPEDERMAITMLRNAGYAPEEIQLLRDIDELKQKLAAAGDEESRRAISKKMDDKMLAYNILLDRRRVRRKPKNT